MPTNTPTPIPVTPTPEPRQTITFPNSNFENGFTGWESTSNSTIIADGFAGQAIQVNNVSNGNSDISYELPIPFEMDRQYKVTVWCRAEEGGECRLTIIDENERLNEERNENQATQILAGNGEWQQLEVTIRMETDDYMDVYLYSKTPNSAVIYDEVQVEEVQCTLLCNGGFEENLAFWESTENTDIGIGRSGNGLRVNHDDENADVRQLLPNTFLAGTSYRVSVWCKALVGDECRLFFGDASRFFNPPAMENAINTTVEGNGDWQHLTLTLTLEQDEQMFVYLYSRTEGSSVLYDDLEIEEIPTP